MSPRMFGAAAPVCQVPCLRESQVCTLLDMRQHMQALLFRSLVLRLFFFRGVGV